MLQSCGAVELQPVGRALMIGAGIQGAKEQCQVHDVMAVACCNKVSELAVKGV